MKKLKKSLSFFLLAAALLALLSSCGKSGEAEVPTGMKLASPDIVPYILYVPQNWTVDISTGVTSAYVSATDKSNISVVFFDTTAEQGSDLAAYRELYADSYSAVFGEEENLSETETSLDGEKALRVSYDGKVAGQSYHFVQVFCVHRSMIFVITFTSLPEKVEEHAEKLSIILGEFRFKK